MTRRHGHKFHATPTNREWPDGSAIKFPSKKEAREYDRCLVEQNTGHLLFFLRQVPFHLPGGITYRLDFLKFWADGTVTMVDAKGVRTPAYIKVKKQVEALYPVEIIEV